MKAKEIIVHIPSSDSQSREIIDRATAKGFRSFYTDVVLPPEFLDLGVKVFSPSSEGDVVVVSYGAVRDVPKGRKFAVEINMEGKVDEKKALEASEQGASAIFVRMGKDRIIPLENLVANLHKKKTRLFAWVDDISEADTFLKVLELGIDGVVISPKTLEDLEEASRLLSTLGQIELDTAKILVKKEVGMGDRACVDTATLLEEGEGLLVGSQASFLFLLNGETTGSAFSAPRPFRVNAGPVHSYVLMPDDKTSYLSELECGAEVLLVSDNGKPRTAVVGRVKIEKRPLFLVRAEADGRIGKILVQNAETIRFATPNGGSTPITELDVGDEVLVRVAGSQGRHFGVSVDESVREV
ncbi:MAG: 3-dehydroquinate synthase II [Candidatus Geothermarchaeales archaeon]